MRKRRRRISRKKIKKPLRPQSHLIGILITLIVTIIGTIIASAWVDVFANRPIVYFGVNVEEVVSLFHDDNWVVIYFRNTGGTDVVIEGVVLIESLLKSKDLGVQRYYATWARIRVLLYKNQQNFTIFPIAINLPKKLDAFNLSVTVRLAVLIGDIRALSPTVFIYAKIEEGKYELQSYS